MSRVLNRRMRRRVLLTTKDGNAYGGVLFEYDREVLVLREARHYPSADTHVAIDGELLLRWEEVAYVQLP